MVGQENDTEEIDSLAVLPDGDFPGVQRESEPVSQKGRDGWKRPLERRDILRNDHEIVGVADVVAYAQIVLDELVEFVEVDVREELRRQVADGDARPVPRSRRRAWEALHDVFQERERTGITQSMPEDVEQDGMVE